MDLRDVIFRDVMSKNVVAIMVANSEGIVALTEKLKEKADEIGVRLVKCLPSGTYVKRGDIIAEIRGNPKQIALAEDILDGIIAKPSGIATASYKASRLANNRLRVVCGAWKKMPIEVKDLFREAVKIGGIDIRILDEPFVYLDKNYVRIFGGIRKALEAVKVLEDRVKVIQIRGETASIEDEALEAVSGGAKVIMVDTGNLDDVRRVNKILRDKGLRGKVMVAFAGNIKLDDIPRIINEDVDIIDIGREIIDAPLLDIKLEVISVED
jgi:nicotinate-nucleotide pyrophosphorylase (carboxylating)